MFERFDDPEPFRPDADFRASVARRGGARRRRRRVLAAGASCLAVVGLVGGAGLVVDARDDAIDRIEVSTEPSTDGATNVLLVGTDGPMAGGARADSIAVLRFDETGTRLLSIPRDLYDPTTESRVNGSLVDGPQALIDAVHRATGIPIDHYIAIEPQGFVDLVDAVGGLRIAVLADLIDAPTGLSLETSECTVLDGATALALARARHLEVDGRMDPTGDLGRISRQQGMLGAALDQIDTDPASIDRLSRLLADHAVVDDGLDLARLVGLGARLSSGPPLVTEVPQVRTFRTPDGAQVLVFGELAGPLLRGFGAPELPDLSEAGGDVAGPVIVRPRELGPC